MRFEKYHNYSTDGLINYKETKTNCRLTVFFRVLTGDYRPQLCELLALVGDYILQQFTLCI
jgi:hypothetical protein